MSITKTALFNNIEEKDQLQMMHCFNSYVKNFSAGSIITSYDGNNKIGIIESGSAIVVRDLDSGSRVVLEYLNEGDLFGELFYHYAVSSYIYVEAKSDCSVRFIDYEHIVKRCTNACMHHSQLVNNVLLMMSDKAQNICEHLDVLSQKSIRDRLISYFEILSSQNDSREFDLPFTFSTLAEYLAIDRSAMSRELKKMKDEELIFVNKKHIKLLY